MYTKDKIETLANEAQAAGDTTAAGMLQIISAGLLSPKLTRELALILHDWAFRKANEYKQQPATN
jgi:hypothetical protein